MSAFFKKEQEARDDKIKSIPHLVEVLAATKAKGINHFVYTHKGITVNDVLERFGVRQYIIEVVTSANGFARKPSPEVIDYVIDKYHLDKARTYYVGDRRLDVEAAENAGIPSLNLGQPFSANNQHIEDLSDIIRLFEV